MADKLNETLDNLKWKEDRLEFYTANDGREIKRLLVEKNTLINVVETQNKTFENIKDIIYLCK